MGKQRYYRDEAALKQLGKRIKQLREQKGWTQEKLALECDIPSSHIGRIETAVINTSVSHVYLIARALDVEPAQLFLMN